MCNLLVLVLNLNNWYRSSAFQWNVQAIGKNIIKDIILLVLSMSRASQMY